jgi:hypothetical protein
MPLNPDDPKVRVAVFGAQVENFLASDIGQYLLQCAKQDKEKAADQLMHINATDTAKVMALQVDLRVADCIETWLAHAISAGLQAFQIQEVE